MNIIDLLEKAKSNFAERVAYQYKEDKISFKEVFDKSLSVATLISKNLEENQPIIVISDKNIFIPSIYLGIAYSNCFYIPVSSEMPTNRINEILNLTKAQIIVCDEKNSNLVDSLNFNGKVFLIDECVNESIDEKLINCRKTRILDTNPLYVIFTSGSTGTPKGVITSHDSVVDYLLNFVETFNISQNEIFGNQAPLDYIAGIRDIYIPLIVGCKTIFLNKSLFSTPILLFEELNKNKITTICWVSAALSLCCQFKVFEKIIPQYLQKVFFTGSVFNYKHLNEWKQFLPNTMFANHYGPTEATASCTYYIVDNNTIYDKNVPIGKPFNNRDVFVLNDKNQIAQTNETGEIYIKGKCLALGYYKNPEKTKENFVNNPLNDIYCETIYKTGDIGYLDENGNLNFIGRLDNQIKYMGHRIELSEIEDVACDCDEVKEACCVFNVEKNVIFLFYSGDATSAIISKFLREKLPSFMIPRKIVNMPTLPKLFNGKIDRQYLKKVTEK